MIERIVSWVNDFGLDHAWVYSAFIVIFLTLLANYIARIVLLRIEKKLMETPNPWDDALIVSLRSPLTLAIWVIGFFYVFQFVEKETQSGFFTHIEDLTQIIIIFLLGRFLFVFSQQVEKNLLNPSDPEKKADETTVSVIGRLARISIIITMGLIIMQALGYSISGVLAFGGVGGIAVGLAAKEMLSNFFGAFMIFLDKPFGIGDWIRSPDKDIEGTVEAIGWRVTKIRRFDKRALYVPNAAFTSISVENPSRMTHRRIHETIGIRYSDINCMKAIVDDVKAMLQSHDEIDSTQTLIVNFNAFSSSSVDFFIYTFTKTTNWVHFHEVKQDVLLKVADIIERHGAEIAFPTSTVHLFREQLENAVPEA